jgi:hypothetical protein
MSRTPIVPDVQEFTDEFASMAGRPDAATS